MAPAMLDDPTSPPIYRTSGNGPFPQPGEAVQVDISPRHVILRDRVTTATLLPFSSPDQVPSTLLSYLCDQLNREIEKGDTYPMLYPMSVEKFGPYWFANFAAIMILGGFDDAKHLASMAGQVSWDKVCLGSFYVKPNYPGRSSHVCNGGFLVTDAARNRGVGRLMGESYLEWAPKLGYTYSVFNLVYETNVASCRIWDALGFKKIGRVPGCGNLRSYPDELIDAIIYGRELGREGDDYVTEERFDKIRFYLQHGKYPDGADRAEKSRLRSAATHYRLLHTDFPESPRLMLKGKEVISDPQQQYEIARNLHIQQHGGINKTTASIAEKYHWVRIKETVSQVIRNCVDCKEAHKVPSTRPEDDNPGLQDPIKTSLALKSSVTGRSAGISNLRQPPFQTPILDHFTVQPSLVTQSNNTNTDNLLDRTAQHTSRFDSEQPFQFDAGLPVDPQLMQEVQSSFHQYDQHSNQSQSSALDIDSVSLLSHDFGKEHQHVPHGFT